MARAPHPADLEAIAANVIRLDDGTYQMTNPPAGFRLAATSPGWIKTGENSLCRLVYTDDNGHGFAIQLVDNTQAPPGAALTVAVARLVDVRGQRAVQRLSSMAATDPAHRDPTCSSVRTAGPETSTVTICSGSSPIAHESRSPEWASPPINYSTSRCSLHEVGAEDWDTLTKTANAIPCAQLARCGAPTQKRNRTTDLPA